MLNKRIVILKPFLPLLNAQKLTSQALDLPLLQLTPSPTAEMFSREQTVNLSREHQNFKMAAGSDTNELMRMLHEGQEELKRSMRDLSTLTGPVNDKKTQHKLTPNRPTRKRARTQQLTPDLVIDLIVCCCM